ncbi:MAG TPA: hypothetical protein VHZ78_13955 [Rhizomicrobium sp.]|jgi:hypothetical protein|nr:hypothetical protein [Rhizomicrobium sp.]
MREDMFKIIVERPRHGWRSRPHARRRFGDDELPVKMGVRRHVAAMGIKSKWLNENLKPLKRYLGQQLGRPWNKVYSEIAATLAPGHTVKQHVRQHIGDFVALKISVNRDGAWFESTRRFLSGRGTPWRQVYYVDPEDGILKESAKLWRKLGLDPFPWRRREPEEDADIRKIDTMRDLRRIDGIWYEVGYDRQPESLAYVFDLIKRTLVPQAARHAVAKRQLSRAELDSFELSNIYKH